MDLLGENVHDVKIFLEHYEYLHNAGYFDIEQKYQRIMEGMPLDAIAHSEVY